MRLRPISAVVLAAGLLLAACGDSSAPEGEVGDAIRASGGDFCQLMKNFEALEQATPEGEDTEFSAAEFKAAVDALAGSLPDEVKAKIDVDLYLRSLQAVVELSTVTDGDLFASDVTDEQQAEIDAINEKYADLEEKRDEINAAQQEIDDHVEQECGISQE